VHRTAVAQPRRGAALGIAAFGAAAFMAGLVLGPPAAVWTAFVFLAACLAAVRETTAPVFTWRTGIVVLVLVIWLVPIRNYRLPVELPFNLEIYRLLLLALAFAWLIAAAARRTRFETADHGKPLALLAAAAVASVIANVGAINEAGLQTEAVKALSFFVSFLIAFVLVASTVKNMRDVDTALVSIVLGGAIVAAAAIYESRARHNIFNDLHEWVPFLDYEGGDGTDATRGGRLRVRASAQHPIALGAALAMCVPLALYLARHAASRFRAVLWLLVGVLLLTGAMSGISRTVPVMLVVMAAVGFWLRRAIVLRLLPLVLLIPIVVPLASPGALRTLYESFVPAEGLIAEQEQRPGTQGSGRLADVEPGVRLWAESPVVGHGLGTGPTRAEDPRSLAQIARGAEERTPIIFDNQYLWSLVSLGVLGLVAIIWFVWGAVVKLARAARRFGDRSGDFMAACAAACAGFGAGMLTYDAFAFVQVTLLFFVVAALGLRMRALSRQ
jgi:polysaccharide biosynthesis protein PslJ